MATIAKCPKCNKEHDLSLAKCPESANIARVLPPTGPKPSPSTSTEAKKVLPSSEAPTKVEVPKPVAEASPANKVETKVEVPRPAAKVESAKIEAKPEPTKAEPAKLELPKLAASTSEKKEPSVLDELKATTELAKKEPPKAEAKPPVLPTKAETAKVEPAVAAPAVAAPAVPDPNNSKEIPTLPAVPNEIIPSNAKTSSPSLTALAASLESKQPPKSEPKKETVVSAEAFVLPPQTTKDKVMGVYQAKVAPLIKGKEKIVAGVAGVLVLLLVGSFFLGGDEPKQPAAPTQTSSLFLPASEATSQATVEAIDDAGGDTAAPGTKVPLEVNVTPADAVIVVWVDGAVAKTGTSPMSTEVPVGSSIEVTLAAAGYSPEQKTFKAKGQKTINESLSKIGAKTSGTGGSKTSGGSKGGWGGWGGGK